ncbi:hypothetical protein [Streptomyces sp. NBC_01198]|uniref:hypothetical protein n=1 Tax=Streptomyces sp. NBC_01198 TaxID=2903769 RepID=UPI002E114CE5|nr:hypothetical protein OG702_03155 [Streptomyces sp. NBC_01198]
MRIAPRSTGGPARVLAVAAVAAAALLAGVTGCSSGSGSGSKPLKALRHLPADVNAGKQVTYVDSARARKLNATDPKRFTTIGQSASTVLNGYSTGPWAEHLKPDQIDTAIDSGVAGRWDGSFDAAAITASLKKAGYTSLDQDGKQVWKPAEGSSGPRFVISKDEISYAVGDTQFSAVDPGRGDSLADNKEYQRVTSCLGDVYRADFNPLTPAKPVLLSALGQQADDSGKNTEVLCVVAKDQATADGMVTKLHSVVKDSGPRFAGTTVTVDKGDHPVVRAAVPDTASQRPGRLFTTDVQLWISVGEG